MVCDIMKNVILKNVFRKVSIGFTGLLTIALVIGKSMGYLDIEWLWVFVPLWLPVAVVLGLMLIVLALIAVALFLVVLAYLVVNAVKIAYRIAP
ncbi:hypothetical protein [uncultured Methanomethylovorans sp.]|uniref:hypothetical protein n=1 Tax=uncultured Methanomethylovorans sp. TaxID=183759 RepID=UPI002612292C|nr:hypothetical protein [uncultured Methanomethylovorans sp.]